MAEDIALLQRISNALKEYKGSKAQKYLDALPEMALGHASNLAAVPAGLKAFFGEESPNFKDKGEAFNEAYDLWSVEPRIDPEVISDVAGLVPDAVKQASRDYHEWSSKPENWAESRIPELAISGFERALKIPSALRFEELRGLPNEEEIRAAGKFSPDGGKTWLHWDPRDVDERGMPRGGLMVKSGLNAHAPGQVGDYTTTHRFGGLPKEGGGLTPAGYSVGGSYNKYSPPGSGGGGARYKALLDTVLRNKMGAASSSMNTVHSAGAWQGLPYKRKDDFDSYMAADQTPMMVQPDSTYSSGSGSAYIQPRGMAPTNWVMFPKDLGVGPIEGYMRNAGYKRNAEGQYPNVAATQALRKVITDPETGVPKLQEVYGSVDDILGRRRRDPDAARVPFKRGMRTDYDAGTRFGEMPRDAVEEGALLTTAPAPLALTDLEERLKYAVVGPDGQSVPRGSVAQALREEPAPAPRSAPTMNTPVSEITEDDWAHLPQSQADLPVAEKEVITIPSAEDLAYFDRQAAATPDPVADWVPEPEPVIPSGPTAAELQALNRERQATATALRNRANANRAEIQRLEGLDVRNPGWDVFRNMKRDSLVRTGDPQVPSPMASVTNRALPRAMMEAPPTNPLMRPENAALVGEGRGVWDAAYQRALRPSSNHDSAAMAADAAKAAFYGMERRPELRDAFLEMMFRTPRYDRP